MISITTLLFSHYKLIISLIAIVPILIAIRGIYKFSPTKIITSIIILLVLLGIFFFMLKKEPSSKYASKAVVKFDETIEKYHNLLNNYDGLTSKLLKEATKIEAELKELHESLDLTQEQKTEIEKALKDNKNKIEEIKNKSKDGQKQMYILNGELIDLEKQKAEKEVEIKQKKDELANTQDKAIRKQLQDEINKLQDERMVIIKQIMKVKNEIGTCENEKEMYEKMLTLAEKFEQELREEYVNLTTGEKALFSAIKTEEERLQTIQTEITNIKNEKEKIEKKIDAIEIERKMADACRIAWDDYDKKHEFSFGNLKEAIFDGFDKYTDYATGRLFLKAAGNMTKKASDFITKTALYFHEAERTFNHFKKMFSNDDETLKMMTKETYDSICARTDRDHERFLSEYRDYQTKIDTLLEQQNSQKLKDEIDNETEQVKNIKTRKMSRIYEYSEIVFRLKEKLKNAGNLNDKIQLQKQLEEIKAQQDELIKATKEELKTQSPNFNSRNDRAKKMKYTRFGIDITKK